MVCIEAIFVGEPQSITDEKGTWFSAIYRAQVSGPIELWERGLLGDGVADTKNHGRLGQAVCVHPIKHYDFWNESYDLRGAQRLGPGSVGENWTISGGDEATIFCGDVYRVGTTIVQVSGPRGPCSKQERKLRLDGFLKRTIDSLRTGFYLRVLQPGIVSAGQPWELEDRLKDPVSVFLVNQAAYREVNRELIRSIVAAEGVVEAWKAMLVARLNGQ
jgi:MOSC domain-containing protein YiiM